MNQLVLDRFNHFFMDISCWAMKNGYEVAWNSEFEDLIREDDPNPSLNFSDYIDLYQEIGGVFVLTKSDQDFIYEIVCAHTCYAIYGTLKSKNGTIISMDYLETGKKRHIDYFSRAYDQLEHEISELQTILNKIK